MNILFQATYHSRVAPADKLILDKANKRMIYGGMALWIILFVVALVLPEGWTQRSGPLVLVMEWIVSVTPSITKASVISPIREVVQGFAALGFLITGAFVLWIGWTDPISVRLRISFSSPTRSYFQTFIVLYLLGLPLCIFMIWVYWALPGSLDPMAARTWGKNLFFAMLSGRFLLGFLGAGAFLGLFCFSFLLTVPIVGPLQLVFKRKEQ